MPTVDIRSGKYEFRIRAPLKVFGQWSVRTLNTDPVARVSAKVTCGKDKRLTFHWKKNLGDSKLNKAIEHACNHMLLVLSDTAERSWSTIQRCKATGHR